MRVCETIGILATLALGQGCNQARANNIPMRFLDTTAHPAIATHYTLHQWSVPLGASL